MKLELRPQPRRTRKKSEPEDPIVAYRVKHYFYESWIGLFETPHQWEALNRAVAAGKVKGFTYTTKDFDAMPVRKSELEKIRAIHEADILRGSRLPILHDP
jgi:hypothetical protein